MVAKVGGKLRMDKVHAFSFSTEYCGTKCNIGMREPTKENIALCGSMRKSGDCPLMRLLKGN